MTNETWLELRIYGIDTSAFEQADNNVIKYNKLVKKLDENIPKCEENLEEIKEMSTKYKTQFTINYHSAVGHIMSNFMHCFNVWEYDNDTIINKMDTALETAKKRRAEASYKAKYWEKQLSIEETVLMNELSSRKEEEKRIEERKKAEEKAKEEKEKGGKK